MNGTDPPLEPGTAKRATHRASKRANKRKRTRLTSILVWAAGAVILLAVLLVGGTYVYIHFIEGPAPKPLALPRTTAPSKSGVTSAPAGSSTGTWHATTASVVGYRVNEVLFGQNHVAVGRTHSVTGTVTAEGSRVSTATFSVPMATVHSDQSQRDSQFDRRIMDVAQYPTATFTLTAPIDLGTAPAIGATLHESATGNLMLHGQRHSVTFPVSARYTGSQIDVTGSIPVTFADWGIPNPSFGGFVSTDSHGILEFLLILGRGAGS